MKELFVYGTLLPGLAPRELEPLLGRLRPAGEAGIAGILFDFGPYPALVIEPEAIAEPAAPADRERFERAWTAARSAADALAPGSGLAGPQPGQWRVRGELFDLPPDPEILRRLDRYEGVDRRRRAGLFERIRARVLRLDPRQPLEAWVYACPAVPPLGSPVPSGDYRAHRGLRGVRW
jgi:gamma-glutamylcyclotransferase (GGCT)/AIG2-like uncharacterized protein YtfP